MRTDRKTASAALAALFVTVMMPLNSFAASEYAGEWKVNDTAGKPFEITLSPDGAAEATRGEGMKGTWKEEGNSAVITWNTGWVTKIRGEDGRYRKSAYRKGQSPEGEPANSSDAQKIK
ncbi:MAG: hypothetical protein WBX25_01080 [Rhodomicrobium sp.]